MALLASNNSPYYYSLYNLERILCAILPARVILNIRESVLNLDSWDVTTDSPPTSFVLATSTDASNVVGSV